MKVGTDHLLSLSSMAFETKTTVYQAGFYGGKKD